MLQELLDLESSGTVVNFSIKRHCALMPELSKYFDKALSLIDEYYNNTHNTNWSIGQLKKELLNYTGSSIIVKHLLFAKQVRALTASDIAKRNQHKIKESNLQKYGVEHSWQRKDVKDKIQQTNLVKYGAKSFFATERFKTTCSNNCLKTHGVSWHSKRKDIKNKIQQTNLHKYGYTSGWNSNLQRRLDEKLLQSYLRCMELLKSQNIQLLSKFVRTHGITSSWAPYKFLCLNCYTEFTSTFANNVYCTHCHQPNYYHKTSKLEEQIVDFLRTNNIKVVQMDRTILKPLELDIYLPEFNIAFEIDGIYYHQYKDKQYHRYKTLKCLEKGIQLYHLRDTYGLDKCLSFIKQKLNMSIKLYARQCKFKELTYLEAKEFFDNNHLHRNTMHSLAFGLTYNDKLVCAISYRKLKDSVEIARFASLKSTNVIGGFSKLLQHSYPYIKQKYSFATKLISYCDRDLSPSSEHTVYSKMGFEYLGDTGPSLTFYKDGEFYSRQMFQKHKLKDMFDNYDDSLSAQQNCINNKVFPIWNSGNFKYQKSLKGDM